MTRESRYPTPHQEEYDAARRQLDFFRDEVLALAQRSPADAYDAARRLSCYLDQEIVPRLLQLDRAFPPDELEKARAAMQVLRDALDSILRAGGGLVH